MCNHTCITSLSFARTTLQLSVCVCVCVCVCAVYSVLILPLRDCFRVTSGRSSAVKDRSDILRAQYYAKRIEDLNNSAAAGRL